MSSSSPTTVDNDTILALTSTASTYECDIAPPPTFLRLTPEVSSAAAGAAPAAHKASVASAAPDVAPGALMTAHSRSSSSASASSGRFLKLGHGPWGESAGAGAGDWSEVGAEVAVLKE